MSDWGSGYVVDVEYTYGYYPELNPLRARMALAHAGYAAPQVRTACELAYGLGLSINCHAAGSQVEWWGTDFNPAQAKFAQECAAASHADAHLYDEAFADFCARGDLPQFDYIGLHGLWSWISEENRAVILEFIRRKLKVGGVLYISYNTMPGWAVVAPLQHLLLKHSEVMGAPGRGIVSRLDAALDFAEKLFATKPRFTAANPSMPERLSRIRALDQNYATHEYLCGAWGPSAFADMARSLEAAKLTFACSAHYLDHVDAVNLTPEQQALLNDIPDLLFRQTVRDFIVNQQFRRDFWVKGARRLSAVEQIEMLERQRLVLVTPRSQVALTVNGAVSQATLQERVYGPILDVLQDHQPRTIAQLAGAVEQDKITSAQVIQAVMVLLGASALQPVQEPELTRKAKPYADRMNDYMLELSRSSGQANFLVSPVTGGGVLATRFQQLFLLARRQGRKQPVEWAEHSWQMLSAQNQRLVREGKALMTAEENVAELKDQAKSFSEERLPLLKALEIA
jgi:SAM-dependent methyltransferase